MLKFTARLSLPLLCLLALTCACPDSPEPLIAYAARIAGDDARTRVVIDFDRKPEFSLHYTAQPKRLIIDLGETDFGFSEDDLKPIGLFSDIRYGEWARVPHGSC